MINEYYIGWVRDEKGKVLSRPVKQIANAVTTMCVGIADPRDGLANTTPHVVYEFD